MCDVIDYTMLFCEKQRLRPRNPLIPAAVRQMTAGDMQSELSSIVKRVVSDLHT